jgi:putative intracellular protease/amidase
MTNTKPYKVIIVAYPGMTMLDAVGPNEVLANSPHFNVKWVATEQNPISNDHNSFSLENLDYYADIDPHNDQCDILLIPGGPGDAALMENTAFLDWIVAIDKTSMLTTSVCTGALILAKAGVLNNQKACPHWACLDELSELGALPVRKRFVQSSKYVSASGVSAGIDMALYLLRSLVSKKHANDIRFGIEYYPQTYKLVSTYSLPRYLLNILSLRFREFYKPARKRFSGK